MYKKKFIVNFVADNVPSSWVQLMPAVQKLKIAFQSATITLKLYVIRTVCKKQNIFKIEQLLGIVQKNKNLKFFVLSTLK